MEPLKNMYSEKQLVEISDLVSFIIPKFPKELFIRNVQNDNWDSLELKARYQHIAKVLWQFMPQDYSSSVDNLIAISSKAQSLDHHRTYGTFPYMFLPTCIEFFGLDDFYNSVRGLEQITQLVSAEFAVRPFFERYPDKMLKQAFIWSSHHHDHVRRLASEGCRPALPWGMALKEFKKSPERLFPILQKLKSDDSLFVRKSVANNLNDISKTHPNLVINFSKKWIGSSSDTEWILKHACRSLLNDGNLAVLQLFG